jgi:hypothetical protein
VDRGDRDQGAAAGAGDDRPGCVEVLELSLAGVGAGGGAVGVVEEGQGAALVVTGQVVLEPGPLGRSVGARRRPGGAAVGVERDRVPGADVE